MATLLLERAKERIQSTPAGEPGEGQQFQRRAMSGDTILPLDWTDLAFTGRRANRLSKGWRLFSHRFLISPRNPRLPSQLDPPDGCCWIGISANWHLRTALRHRLLAIRLK
jgi:hypothetical protein